MIKIKKKIMDKTTKAFIESLDQRLEEALEENKEFNGMSFDQIASAGRTLRGIIEEAKDRGLI